MNFEQIKTHFDKVKAIQQLTNPVHPKIRGVLVGLLDKACGSKENRYQFAIKLGLPPHSKDWTSGEWFAISQMVKVDKNPAIGWMATEPNFEKIIGLVMAEIGNNESQIKMFDGQ